MRLPRRKLPLHLINSYYVAFVSLEGLLGGATRSLRNDSLTVSLRAMGRVPREAIALFFVPFQYENDISGDL